MTDIDKFNEKTHFLDGVLLKMLGIIMVPMREREREREFEFEFLLHLV